MIELTGTVTEVCKFSRLEDQIIILVPMPSITGEEGGSHCLDGLYPCEQSSGTTFRVAFIE
jgi:hypothetical protein